MPPEKSRAVDVVVFGGGPAGLSLSILLARRGLSVVVLERSRYERARAGETFGGELISLLQSVGLWDELQEVPRTPFRGVRSSWGEAGQIERSALFNPFGEGWHVDRVAFDSALAAAAVRAGVSLFTGAVDTRVERVDEAWAVRLNSGEGFTGRFLVDASGRDSRALPPCCVRRWIQMDRLVALIARLTPPTASPDPILELEAVEDGWWYSAPQPNGGLLATLMTDADLLASGERTSLSAAFTAALAQTTHTARRCAGASIDGQPWVARADSGFLFPDRGDGWCAIGDAAMACDPLGGDGVVRAIRSAVAALPFITRTLTGGEGTPPASAPDDSKAPRLRFIDYLDMRGRYYAREGRFPEATFWLRRQPMDWQAAPISLDPGASLFCQSAMPARDLLAPVESLIPMRALHSLLHRLRRPLFAHEALASLRAEAPFEDRRLVVAVQALVAQGIVVAR